MLNERYKTIAHDLGLSGWEAVAWTGRCFCLNNDYGEYWFDNWELRENLEQQARLAGIPYDDLLIIKPERFYNKVDGPCHMDTHRKVFWTHVLSSMELGLELIFSEAHSFNATEVDDHILTWKIELTVSKQLNGKHFNISTANYTNRTN